VNIIHYKGKGKGKSPMLIIHHRGPKLTLDTRQSVCRWC